MELEQWSQCLLREKRKHGPREDAVLRGILNFMDGYDKSSFQNLDDDLKKEIDRVPLLHEPPESTDRIRHHVTPAKYRVS